MSFLRFRPPGGRLEMALGLLGEWARRWDAARGRGDCFSGGVGRPMLLATLPAVGLPLALSEEKDMGEFIAAILGPVLRLLGMLFLGARELEEEEAHKLGLGQYFLWVAVVVLLLVLLRAWVTPRG